MMEEIEFRTFTPSYMLQPYIGSIFAFETKSGLPKSEFSLIAPNGQVKLVIPYKNNMRSTIAGVEREHKEGSCFVIGLSTQAAHIDCDNGYGNLCVEFKPGGAYRFFDESLGILSNGIYDVDDVFKNLGRELQRRIWETPLLEDKVMLLQEFLCNRLVSLERRDPIADYVVQKIMTKNGLIRVNDLCTDIGYSRRHLYNKFEEYIGVSPKEFICIVRFNQMYKIINLDPSNLVEAREPYHDQSHFIRDFKKFTGYTPGEYIRKSNSLGTIFFQQ